MPLSGHDDAALLNDDSLMTLKQHKIENYVIIASLKSETMGKLIKRIPGLLLLISMLPGSALRTHVESLSSLAMSTSVLKALPGKLDIKRHSPRILYMLSSFIPPLSTSSKISPNLQDVHYSGIK